MPAIFRSSGLLLLLSLLGTLTACGPSSSASDRNNSSKPMLIAIILPQEFLLKRIAGPGFAISTLVGQGQSPHSYEPSPRQMSELATAAIWFRIGIDFENSFAPKVLALYPKLPIYNVSDGIAFRVMENHSHEGEDEGEPHAEQETEDHIDAPGTPDVHVWLGEASNIVMARNVRDALIAQFPDQASSFQTNYDSLVIELQDVFSRLKTELAPLKGQTAFVFHPSFGYLFDELGIVQEAVETGGKEPSQKQLANLITQARADKVKTIFIQTQFPTAAAKNLADSLGAAVVPLDPLSADVLDNLRRIGAALKHGISN